MVSKVENVTTFMVHNYIRTQTVVKHSHTKTQESEWWELG